MTDAPLNLDAHFDRMTLQYANTTPPSMPSYPHDVLNVVFELARQSGALADPAMALFMLHLMQELMHTAKELQDLESNGIPWRLIATARPLSKRRKGKVWRFPRLRHAILSLQVARVMMPFLREYASENEKVASAMPAVLKAPLPQLTTTDVSTLIMAMAWSARADSGAIGAMVRFGLALAHAILDPEEQNAPFGSEHHLKAVSDWAESTTRGREKELSEATTVGTWLLRSLGEKAAARAEASREAEVEPSPPHPVSPPQVAMLVTAIAQAVTTGTSLQALNGQMSEPLLSIVRGATREVADQFVQSNEMIDAATKPLSADATAVP